MRDHCYMLLGKWATLEMIQHLMVNVSIQRGIIKPIPNENMDDTVVIILKLIIYFGSKKYLSHKILFWYSPFTKDK